MEVVNIASAPAEVVEIAGTEVAREDNIDLAAVEGYLMEGQQVLQGRLHCDWDDLSLHRLQGVNAYSTSGPVAGRPIFGSGERSGCRNSRDRYRPRDRRFGLEQECRPDKVLRDDFQRGPVCRRSLGRPARPSASWHFQLSSSPCAIDLPSLWVCDGMADR